MLKARLRRHDQTHRAGGAIDLLLPDLPEIIFASRRFFSNGIVSRFFSAPSRPRPFGRGISSDRAIPARIPVTSMGPRPFGRGLRFHTCVDLREMVIRPTWFKGKAADLFRLPRRLSVHLIVLWPSNIVECSRHGRDSRYPAHRDRRKRA